MKNNISEVSFYFKYEDGTSSPATILKCRYNFNAILYDLISGNEISYGKITISEKLMINCRKCKRCSWKTLKSRYVWKLTKDISDDKKKEIVDELERHEKMLRREGDKIVEYGIDDPFFFTDEFRTEFSLCKAALGH